MDTLTFHGTVQSGAHEFNTLEFPDAHEVDGAPDDWPGRELYEGSLNVHVAPKGYPDKWSELGKSRGLRRFDEKRFQPAFVIPGDLIANNTIDPGKYGMPDAGDVQVWRARLQNDATREVADCWLVRRIASDMEIALELMAIVRLRAMGLERDGSPVTVTVCGTLYVEPPRGTVRADAGHEFE
jgi:hypothetical protein